MKNNMSAAMGITVPTAADFIALCRKLLNFNPALSVGQKRIKAVCLRMGLVRQERRFLKNRPLCWNALW